ncbi:uncharacterized protein LOC109806513 [Cajanus cajan]|uniref:Transmembrane protein n=1 Tax=Cajanus cajan TaxID=3821 RepID=A0A151SUS0_CAJCA|nr:uncharacterized protein LOC109806513 [Cajanus cajan]KYP58517.1 hypothetical protein KK1_013928 [Cajanus cajan]
MATAFASSSIATFISSSANSHSCLPLPTSKKFILFGNPLQKNSRLLRPIILLPPVAAAEDVNNVISSETAVDATQQLYPETDEGVATVVSALFFFAFIGLSAITIGVIYLAVTDFLQKREKEKFEKEEGGKKGKKKRKKVGRARAGPRGFGQKVVEDEDDDVIV